MGVGSRCDHRFIQSRRFDALITDGNVDACTRAGIALAITPEYLHQVGLLDQVPSADNDIPQLLKQAMDRVAFLPFGFMIDQ